MRFFAVRLLLAVQRGASRLTARLLRIGADEARKASCGTLLPPPTFDELVNAILRFCNERAPAFPAEAVGLALFVEKFGASTAPALERLRAALPDPPPEPFEPSEPPVN